MARPRVSNEIRRESILAAARTVFIEYGLGGARTRLIAREAGVTEALLYRHFVSKAELFECSVLEPLETLITELAQIFLRNPSPAVLRLGGPGQEVFRHSVDPAAS
jgi:AcrR family transcriptional regulator